MSVQHLDRVMSLQERLHVAGLDGALVTDPDSIFYLSGYWGYAGIPASGRPTMLWVPKSEEPIMITPVMEHEMCQRLSSVQRIRAWMDGADGEWMSPLRDVFGAASITKVALEAGQIPGLIAGFLADEWTDLDTVDLSPILNDIRMIKSADEIRVMRDAGLVAVAMAAAGERAIDVGVPEYEVSLSALAGGTRKAAELLNGADAESFFSPMIHNLQILQSGSDTCMVHRRPTLRKICNGDPVYLCFCGITVFKGYWLGFDREFFCRSVTDEQARVYELAVQAQEAALGAVKPGAIAEEGHFAADAVYRDAGLAPTYRTGRGTGFSMLEQPQLKAGDKTVLQPGMTFAVDGGITIPGEFGARVGDTIVVTESGFDCLTPYPKELRVLG